MSSLKINPVGWRLNINCSWNGVWYNKSNYSSWFYIESIFKELVSKFFSKFSYLTKEIYFFQNKISIYMLILLQKKKKNRLGIRSFFFLSKNKRILFCRLYLRLKKKIWVSFLKNKASFGYSNSSSRFFHFYLHYKLDRRVSLFSVLLKVLGLFVNKYIVVWLKHYTRFRGSSLVSDYFKSRVKFSKRNRQYRLLKNISSRLSRSSYNPSSIGIALHRNRDRFFLSNFTGKHTVFFLTKRLLFNAYPITNKVLGFKVISKGRSSEIKSRRSVKTSFGFGPMGFKQITNRISYVNSLLVGRMGTFNIRFYFLYSSSILDTSYKIHML